MNLQHISHTVGGIRTPFGRLRSIAPCERGHTMVEFAIIGPVFLALLLSILEFSGVMFVQTLLEGGAREASRYGITGAIPEGISRAQMIRQIVEENTFGLVETEDLYMETLVYDSFSAVGEPEPFTDENRKVDRVAVTMSDLVSRAETVSESDMFVAAGQVAQPFDIGNLGVVIVSSVTNPDGSGPVIAWQRSGGGALSATSELGIEGGAASLSADFEVREGETAITAEVFYDFEPFVSELVVAPQTLYRRAHHRPRLGTLETVDP